MTSEHVFKSTDNHVLISSGNTSTKFVAVKFLTNETVYFGVEKKCKVNELFSKICVHLGLADCAELFGLSVKQINCPTSIFGPLTNSNYYSASQVEESIKQDDSQFEEEYIFLNPNAKLSKYTTNNWKNSKNGLDPMGKAYLQCFFRVQFYVDSYLFITDRIARHHYYLQLRQNVINYNLSNLTLERAFLLTSLALQAEKGNYNEKQYQRPSSSILNSTFINNENYNFNGQDAKFYYFDPYNYMPKWIIYQMGENYIIDNMPCMHREQNGISRIDAEIMFIKEASEICAHNLHMYRLYKTNPSTFSKKLSSVNNHFNAFFHGHHFNSSIHSNSSHTSSATNHSSLISNTNLSNSFLGHSSTSKESKVWLAICATGVQIYDMECLNRSVNTQTIDYHLKEQDQSSVCYLRSKLSNFNWSDIEKLFFDKKKFEIRSNGYPTRRFTYYTHSDEMAKNLLWLCKFSHRFQLFIQPKLKEMKKRENELSRRKYRESYIYSEEDKQNESSSSNQIKLKTENWMVYQQEPINKYLYFNNNSKKDEQNSPLSSSKNTLVSKESLETSQNYNISPLSKDMKPIMDKFDRQISKLQFNNELDLSSSNDTEKMVQNFTEQPADHVDFANSLDCSRNQINTNPFLDASNFKQLAYQSKPIENFDEFVIEHKDDSSNGYNHINNSNLSMLTVQPSEPLTKTDLEFNEIVDRPLPNQNNLRVKLGEEFTDKPNKQTFSLESLTCSGLSEPSSSGISEQEFSTSSCASGNDKKNISLINQINQSNLNHQNTESPISEQSRCSSNTSYSSDSALSKSSKHTQTKPPIENLIENEHLKPKQFYPEVQKRKNFAYSVNDLHSQLDDKENYISSIRNNQLFKDYEKNQNFLIHNKQVNHNQTPKQRTRKSKFELKNKNKLNGMYKSLPNVNSFENSRFGLLDLNIEEEDDLMKKERFNFINKSDKSTSSEQSVSTIKSNNKTNSSTKLSESSNDNKLNEIIQQNFLNLNKSNQPNWYKLDTSLVADKSNSSFNAVKHSHIYENLPFQKTVNDLLATNLSSNQNRTPTINSFQPVPNLITTTPNRIGTKIGISSLNRCNKLNSAQKNQTLKLNLLNNSLDRPVLRTSCSYQLLDNKNLSTINDQTQSSPFKTTRASSDPGVLTYSSTGDLVKVSSKDSVVFYQNPPTTNDNIKLSSSLNRPSITSPQSTSLNANSFDTYQSISNSIFYSSLNTINDENLVDNFVYEKQLNNQIINQQKISNRKNQNFPIRLAESEMNLISNSDQCPLDSYNIYPPPYKFSDKANVLDKKIGKFKASSEQQLNRIEPTKFAVKLNEKLNLNERQRDSIDSLEKLKERTHDLDLPLISQLFQDRTLMMLPKTVPNCSRETHQKPKRYSLENNRNAIDLKSTNQKQSTQDKPYQQTNLDDSLIHFNETNLDSSLIENYPKYDKNFNLESNNLNKLQLEHKIPTRNAEIVDKIWKK